ncbi:MAG: phosphopyruvate hydratase [Candidatus Pelagibacter sp.]|nr:phosphopyruvate hydratase [Candidatus Pelagibacter sp.]OUV87281.1 MAG: phosphopyruvate hydratase [Pelagibacteraceae bacterium TMED136]|tara:strand:- start:10197 stop:11450 length:1254 start_codon:yes stop_codon:yes gene_type:complete
MSKISFIKSRQVFDSRGFPTIETDVVLSDGSIGSAIIPSGASTGSYEAYELRDQNEKYLNKSVFKAIENVNIKINDSLKGIDCFDQTKIDNILIELDGTKNKSSIGANAILSVSIANCKAAAKSQKKEIYEYLSKTDIYKLPYPLMNIINGGAHANNSLNIQEFMIRPDGANNFEECIQFAFLTIQNLKKILDQRKLNTSVGDEGGFAPNLNSDEEAIELILESISKSGFTPGNDINICLDIAANELYEDKKYSIINNKNINSEELIDYYKKLITKYPIKSLEDPIFEDDWKSWTNLTKAIGDKVQVVGDDLFVTNFQRLEKGINELSANSILIKLNQIGTITETLKAIQLAQKKGLNTIISHRSGDTEDTFIADLAIATKSNQIKTGSLARSERVAKYNRLLRIEEKLKKPGMLQL